MNLVKNRKEKRIAQICLATLACTSTVITKNSADVVATIRRKGSIILPVPEAKNMKRL